MGEVKALLKASKAFGMTEKFAVFWADETASVGIYAPDILGGIRTAVKQARTVKMLTNIGSKKIQALVGYHNELVELLVRTGDNGVTFVKNMEDVTLRKMFSLSVRGSDTQLMGKLRGNLVKLNTFTTGSVPSGEIKKFIDNIDKLKDIKGIDKVVRRVSTAGNSGNFKGAAFEVEYAASRNIDDIIEMGAKPIGVSRPGDIDILMKEGGKKVGYELKDRNFASWSNFKYDMGDISAGYRNMIKNGEIDGYKIVFKEAPPINHQGWLNSKKIPWETWR